MLEHVTLELPTFPYLDQFLLERSWSIIDLKSKFYGFFS